MEAIEDEGQIDQARLEIKFKTDLQPSRRQNKQKQAPSVNKKFFEEVDEASSLLKLVLQENIDRRERQSSKLKVREDVDVETLDESKQMMRTASKERHKRREVKSVQGSTNQETFNGSLTMSPGMHQGDMDDTFQGIYYCGGY